jgi:hypothetical protein
MRKILLVIIGTCLTLPLLAQEASEKQPVFTLGEQVWVLFHDLPSRRFRSIRDAFVASRFEVARQDLEVSGGFFRAETARAIPVLHPPMTEVTDRLQSLAADIENPDTTVRDLDPVFARAHWSLAQHYLTLATEARNASRHRNAGHYLFSTAHHMERAVLWSDARVDRMLFRTLETTRDMADQLRASDRPERIYRDKPIDNARRTLLELGLFLDRKVWIDPVPM